MGPYPRVCSDYCSRPMLTRVTLLFSKVDVNVPAIVTITQYILKIITLLHPLVVVYSVPDYPATLQSSTVFT